MLQDPEGLRREGELRRQDRLVRTEVLRLLDAERIGLRHTLADALRRVAQRIDPLVMEPPMPQKGPDGPRPAN